MTFPTAAHIHTSGRILRHTSRRIEQREGSCIIATSGRDLVDCSHRKSISGMVIFCLWNIQIWRYCGRCPGDVIWNDESMTGVLEHAVYQRRAELGARGGFLCFLPGSLRETSSRILRELASTKTTIVDLSVGLMRCLHTFTILAFVFIPLLGRCSP